MWNLPIDQIDIQTVRTFCAEGRAESLDLDYKQDWENDLETLICAMANIQGGMILVGVVEQPGTGLPVCPPTGVLGTVETLRHKVLQIAFDNIYPPVIPEVKVCPLDDDPDRAVVVIRVDPSRLMHATQNRTRIYIKVEDIKRSYKLANLTELEWLFQRRQPAIDFRSHILERAKERADYFADRVPDSRNQSNSSSNILATIRLPNSNRVALPHLILSIIPEYPDRVRDITPTELLGIGRSLPRVKAKMWQNHPELPFDSFEWRTTANGIYNDHIQKESATYLELGRRASIFLYHQMEPEIKKLSEGEYIRRLRAPVILRTCDQFLLYADAFYKRLRWEGPVLLNCQLSSILDAQLDLGWQLHGRTGYDLPDRSLDNEISLLRRELRPSALAELRDTVLTEIIHDLIWGFSFGGEDDWVPTNYLAYLKTGKVPVAS